MRNNRLKWLSGAVIAAAILWTANPVLSAAHLYATTPEGKMNVYDVAANGSLRLRQAVPHTGLQMVITPRGRFLYTASGEGWIQEWAVQADGTLLKWGPPVRNAPWGINDIAMHPSGDFLFVTEWPQMAVWRTAEPGGMLSLVEIQGAWADGPEALAVDPGGRFLYVGGTAMCAEGEVQTMKVGPDGKLTDFGRFTHGPGMTRTVAADTRFVYVSTGGRACPTTPEEEHLGPAFVVMAIGADGSLKTVQSYKENVGPILTTGRFLIHERDDHLVVRRVGPDGAVHQTDLKPIRTFALAADKEGRRLWVATDDGIVTYNVGADGKLTRISKTMVKGVGGLTFGLK